MLEARGIETAFASDQRACPVVFGKLIAPEANAQ